VQIYLLLPLFSKPLLDLNLEVPDYQTSQPAYKFSNMYEKINHPKESNFVLGKASTQGVPMGLGYSPILAMLILCEVLKEWKNDSNDFITYADDGLLFMKNEEDILNFERISRKYNLKLNLDKSLIVKQNDIYLTKFKFLGLIFDGSNNSLISSTRKGYSQICSYVYSTSKLSFLEGYPISLLENKIAKLYELKMFNPSNLQTIFEQKVIGYKELIAEGVFSTILSRLYSSCHETKQNFQLYYKKRSTLGLLTSRSNLFNLNNIRKNYVKNVHKTSIKLFHTSSYLNVKLSFYNYDKISAANHINNKSYNSERLAVPLKKLITPDFSEINVFNHSTICGEHLIKQYKEICRKDNTRTRSLDSLIKLYELK
jgi:Reverse transcriptase (RNA-dependent DNA polymerase)